MATANLHIHEVSRVSITSERLGNKMLQRVVIYDGERVQMRLTLYGLDSAHGDIPYTFAKIEDEEPEPPPALKLEIQRDLDGAVRHAKVFGDFLDSMLSPKRS